MKGFRQRLQRAIDASDHYKNVYDLAETAGLGRKTIYNMLRDERLDHSQTGPGIFGISRVAALLGVSLDHLAGQNQIRAAARKAEQGSDPLATHVLTSLNAQAMTSDDTISADAPLRLHTKSGARVEAFSHWIDRADQYFIPANDDCGIKVKHVGDHSLSAITMGTASAELLQTALDTVDDKALKTRWKDDYRTAAQRGMLVTVETLDVQMPNHPVRVKMDFVRCLLCVQDAEGDKSVLNFSLLVV